MITYEADQQHVDLLARAYGLDPETSKGRAFITKNLVVGVPLPAEQARAFKSRCMCNMLPGT
eukprot:12894573-Prorocentrum_lima.AAC.1